MQGIVRRPLLRAASMFGLAKPKNRIFLLSHMRGNTSLLSHILGSNDGIEGYYELHQSYCDGSALIDAQKKYYSHHFPKLTATLFFDKILHNHLELNPKLVKSEDKLIFMVREPQATISSMIRNFSNRPNSRWSTQEECEEYYMERLQWLASFAESLNQPFISLSAESLVKTPDPTLTYLSHFLQLKTPLDRHYHVFPNTGKRGFGDSSMNISRGQILTPSGNSSEVVLSSAVETTYESVMNSLAEGSVKEAGALYEG